MVTWQSHNFWIISSVIWLPPLLDSTVVWVCLHSSHFSLGRVGWSSIPIVRSHTTRKGECFNAVCVLYTCSLIIWRSQFTLLGTQTSPERISDCLCWRERVYFISAMSVTQSRPRLWMILEVVCHSCSPGFTLFPMMIIIAAHLLNQWWAVWTVLFYKHLGLYCIYMYEEWITFKADSP